MAPPSRANVDPIIAELESCVQHEREAPEEVADAVAWLLGSHSSFATGSDLVLDGGFGNVEPVLRREAGM